jgi:hypothetical protein
MELPLGGALPKPHFGNEELKGSPLAWTHRQPFRRASRAVSTSSRPRVRRGAQGPEPVEGHLSRKARLFPGHTALSWTAASTYPRTSPERLGDRFDKLTMTAFFRCAGGPANLARNDCWLFPCLFRGRTSWMGKVRRMREACRLPRNAIAPGRCVPKTSFLERGRGWSEDGWMGVDGVDGIGRIPAGSGAVWCMG